MLNRNTTMYTLIKIRTEIIWLKFQGLSDECTDFRYNFPGFSRHGTYYLTQLYQPLIPYIQIKSNTEQEWWRDGCVGIVGCNIDDRNILVLIPAGARDFCSPFRPEVLWSTHRHTSCTGGSFSEVKRPDFPADSSRPSSFKFNYDVDTGLSINIIVRGKICQVIDMASFL